MQHFNLNFEDCTWTEAWTQIPIAQLIPGKYPSFTITSWEMDSAEICGQQMRINPPLPVRGLVMPDGTMWMSDVPQERLMMYNNAQVTRGHVLVGGLGVGLYPQYALPHATAMTIIEREAALIPVVEPLVQMAATAQGIPLTVQQGDILNALQAEPDILYDTIFLDTWDTLDALHLPMVNTLRDLAFKHLSADGQVLCWGYGRMLGLFTEACVQLLTVPLEERERWLQPLTQARPAARDLLRPVIEHFVGQTISDMDAALAWCRDYAIRVTQPNPQ